MSGESVATDPYEVVLADLRAQREKIDQAIAAIERLTGRAPGSAGASSAASSGGTGGIDGPGAFLGLTIADAAKKILAARRQPLRNADLVTAFKAGGLVMGSNDPINTVGSVLTRRFNEVGDIVRVDRGIWGLKEWYPNRTFKKKDDADEGAATP